jgi:hypothetical protein
LFASLPIRRISSGTSMTLEPDAYKRLAAQMHGMRN